MVIEIDGLYAHNLICDGIERTIPDYARFSKVPENVKFIVCDENKVEDCFAEILKYYGVDYENWIKDIIKSLPLEFPYPTYEDKRMKKDWENLKRLPVIIDRNYVGHSLIRNFHKSIWEARVGNHMTPIEAWNNRKCIDTCVRNRVIYSSDLSSQSIVDGFNIAKIAPKVSVFRVGLAKNLVQKYLSDYSTIFDPFSGFSGRMLGACALDKKYIGQDINLEHVKESNQIIKFLDLDATVIQKDIFESNGEYECLFTCSPYNLKEQWNDNETDLSCDDWIDECLKRFKCKRYLFVVDKTEKYKDNVVERLGNTSHFSNNNELVILIEK
jgi:DNA modification methylase